MRTFSFSPDRSSETQGYLCLGAFGAQTLLRTKEAISRLRAIFMISAAPS